MVAMLPPEYPGGGAVRTMGGPPPGMRPHHRRLHTLLPPVPCLWEASRRTAVPRQGGPTAGQGRFKAQCSHCLLGAVCLCTFPFSV